MCGMSAPWIVTKRLVNEFSTNFSERIVYRLERARIATGVWDRTTRTWTQSETVKLGCCKKLCAADLTVVLASVRDAREHEIKLGDGRKRVTTRKKIYSKEYWCIECARRMAAEHGGQIGWLFGAK